MSALLLTRSEVEALLSPLPLVDAIRDGFVAAAGAAISPQRARSALPGGGASATVLFPGLLPGANLTGILAYSVKVHAKFPGETPAIQRQRQLVAQERWIIDGNYGSTMDLRLAAADTVIFLDTPRLRCLRRVLKRRLSFHNRTHPDMSAGNPERLTGEFLRFVWNYPKQRSAILQRLAQLEGKRVIHLRGDHEVAQFLDTVRRSNSL